MPSETREFDVASIKPSKSSDGRPWIFARPNGLQGGNLALQNLLWWAYGPRRYGDYPISGMPKWAESARFDMDAKITEQDANRFHKMPEDQQEHVLALMLRALLADRFQLQLHKGPIVLPVYELVIAKNGPRLREDKPMDPELPNGEIIVKPGQIWAQAVHIQRLANQLAIKVQRGVLDKTGLASAYTFSLNWQADEPLGSIALDFGAGGQQEPAANNFSGLSIFSALTEQLGLQLKAAKGSGEALIIDHVEKPSPN